MKGGDCWLGGECSERMHGVRVACVAAALKLTGALAKATSISSAPPRSVSMPVVHVLLWMYCSMTSFFKVSLGSVRVACFCRTLPMLLPDAASTVTTIASHIANKISPAKSESDPNFGGKPFSPAFDFAHLGCVESESIKQFQRDRDPLACSTHRLLLGHTPS